LLVVPVREQQLATAGVAGAIIGAGLTQALGPRRCMLKSVLLLCIVVYIDVIQCGKTHIVVMSNAEFVTTSNLN
jgi:hypothetical protein